MTFWSRFKADRRGASAVEFALIAPLMLIFYCGLTELCQAMLAERRVGHVSAAVGDLVTQTDKVTTTDLGDIFLIGNTVMSPFPNTTLKMRTTSVTANALSKPVVDWSRGYGGLTAIPKGQILTDLPAGLTLDPQTSLVISEAQYKFTSPLGYFLPNGIQFVEKSYLRPRRSAKVDCSNC
jgi:Flp pilus assembly protein TadG